ncbi:unnamed protein product [Mytilus coruscus]|uniref:Novel STAND NTPase 3 domain-containing protein n=1 Tax=Mytilus coruscus TaxID=42192 RepID=A0A6J8BFH7_MYTCO|nr:unnamed protein product [Mytilus coruscus]
MRSEDYLLNAKISCSIHAINLIKDIYQTEVAEWEQQIEKFVTTRAVSSILALIQKKNSVTVIGHSGKGKSAYIHFIAIHLRNNLEYQIVPCHSPSDITDYYNINTKQVFVIDDICGKYTLIQSKVNEWKDYESRLGPILRKTNGHTKILASCRNQIFEDGQFKRLKHFTDSDALCDLSSESNALTDTDLIAIASKYIPANVAENMRNEFPKHEFLPLLFTLYQSCYEMNQDLKLKEFLKYPFIYYTEEIEELREAEDRTKYCALFFLIAYNGCICKKTFTGEESLDIASRRKDICDEFGINGPKFFIFDQLNSLLKLFVKAEGYENDKLIKHYALVPIHDKMFDFLCNYFGQHNQIIFIRFSHIEIFNNRTQFVSLQENNGEFTVMIESENEEIYFDRIVKDLLNGSVTEVFYNQQMKFRHYRSRLINYMQNRDPSIKTKIINVTSKNGWTLLMHACSKGYDDIVRFLINEKACIHTETYDGQSAIRIACNRISPFEGIVELLLKNGVNPNASFDDGWTLLSYACLHGNIKIVELLLNAGADVNLVNENGDTPLTSSVVFGHLEVMKLLVEKGATLNIPDKHGLNPLTAAYFYGHFEIVTFLTSDIVTKELNKAMSVYSNVTPSYSKWKISQMFTSKHIQQVAL